ncbi:pentapeptide MXKDX repeat protein [Raoultella planticola]|uniref:Pentapeptide MXKDX repeat protein n=1 Tax=Raoultella planticola TaxID=575 RepID=A0A485CH52_RAOPL|nr:pentapeptide MXKDX repeat protein [Raoultella planticola]
MKKINTLLMCSALLFGMSSAYAADNMAKDNMAKDNMGKMSHDCTKDGMKKRVYV